MGGRPHFLFRGDPRSVPAIGTGRRDQPATAARHFGIVAAPAASDTGGQAGQHAGSSDRGTIHLGVGVGGEFPREYAACDVPHYERGARLAEGVAVLRKFFSGQPVSHHGKFYGPFEDVPMSPPPRQAGGPPIWFAGRKEAALRRIGRLGDGYLSYVVTPKMYSAALQVISEAAEQAGRGSAPFGTGHLLFVRLDRTYEAALDRATETLSVRYAMDFRKAAERYCALGTPQMVAERIRAFHAAGVRHVVLDLLGPNEQKAEQIAWFARDALPLLDDLTTGHSRSGRSTLGGTP